MKSLLGVLICATLLSGCATSRYSDGSQPGPITSDSNAAGKSKKKVGAEEEKVFQRISEAHASRRFQEVVELSSQYFESHPKGKLKAQIRNYGAMAALMLGRPKDALEEFRLALKESSDARLKEYIRFNLVSTLVESEDWNEANSELRTLNLESLDSSTRLKADLLRAKINLGQGKAELALRQSLKQYGVSPELTPHYSHIIDRSLETMDSTSNLQDIFSSHNRHDAADRILFRIGKLQMESGNKDLGRGTLRQLVEEFPYSKLVQTANEEVTKAVERNPGNPTKVGILLPFKGKFGKFGYQSLRGIEHAFGIFSAEKVDSSVRLILEDSGETAESAMNALEKLVQVHDVVAVIGPVLSRGVDALAKRANELGVPLLVLSQSMESSGIEFAFSVGFSPKAQTRDLVRLAMSRLGAKRFGVVFPEDRFGRLFSQSFVESVEEQGGAVTAISSYESSAELDFNDPVKKMAGTFYLEARQDEVDAMAQARVKDKITKRNSKTRKYFDLPPIVDFDAVFIPEEPKIAGQIIPTFSYQDVDGVKFLGTSGWNSKEMVLRAGALASQCFFVDGALDEKFVKSFSADYDYAPTSIEAVAFDAGSLLRNALFRDQSRNREEVRQSLQTATKVRGATGSLRVEKGTVFRDFQLFGVKSGEIVVAGSGP